MFYPKKIFHWLNDEEIESKIVKFFKKVNPVTGEVLAKVTNGGLNDVATAINLAEKAYPDWSLKPVKERAVILKKATDLIEERKIEIASIVAIESGKPLKIAVSEVEAAIKCGRYLVDQLYEFESQLLSSSVPGRKLELVRKSIGVGLLITPFNNPMAGIAWKAFPALLSGNAVIVKAHRDTPYVPIWFGMILKEAGLPTGVYAVLHGSAKDIGMPLVKDKRIKFISLTGSLAAGQQILKDSADRLAKVSIEAGGKNPFVVCDDADLERAASAAVAGAFVDAGQRCAATSRIIVFDKVYNEFKKIFLEKVNKLKVGTADNDDFGAIINENRLKEILSDIQSAVQQGATLLAGGHRLKDEAHKNGYFIAPTVLENVLPDDEFSKKEIFGPAVALYRAKDFEEAIRLANNSEFRLTSAIHTKNLDRAKEFIKRHQTGVVRVNGPTHGSEPHVPFGGVSLSGNGWREPGVKALDFYSDWKQVSLDSI